MNSTTPNKPDEDNKVQGEGDYEAARRYDKAAHDFAQSGKVEPAARKAEPKDAREASELEQAEEIGKSHAKGEDPGDAR
ncbi:MAG: hypothetical protein ABI605_21415 [Rhizobacter sp.]